MTNINKNIFDHIYVIVKWRRRLIVNFFIVCLFMAGFSVLLPRWFTAHTTILPSSGDSGNFDFSSIMGQLPLSSMGLGMGPQSENTAIIIAILDSRTVMETVAIKFDLQKRYKCKDIEKTIKVLRKCVDVQVDEEGTVSLSMKVRTPWFLSKKMDDEARQLSMEIANYFIEITDEMNKRLKIESARNTRLFVEKRYSQNLQDMKSAEDSLKHFQEKHGTIALPEQTAATINAAAEIKAEIMAKEVEMNVIGQMVGDNNQNYLKAQHEVNELKKKYGSLFQNVEKNTKESKFKDVFLPISDIPDLGVHYARLYRDLLIQEKLLEFLLPQYEQSKIQEAKNTPTIQILDKAIMPIKKSSPKRALLVLLAGFLSLLCTYGYVLINESFKQMQEADSENYHKIIEIEKLLHNNKKKNQ